MIQRRQIEGRLLACWVNGSTFPPGSRTLVFVHGAGGDHRLWERQYTALDGDFPIAAVDLPGHGDSPGPGEQEVDRYAGWVKEMLAGWGIVRPVLIGHSLGAAVCLALASRWGDAAAAVVPIGGGVKMPVNPDFLDSLKRDPVPALALAAHYGLARANRERLSGLLTEGFSRTDPEVLYGDFLACDRLDLGAKLGGIRVPTLVLCGSEDRMTKPSLAAGLRDAIAGAGLSLIEGAGHFVMIEAPEAFNRALGAFVRSLPERDEPLGP